jgi:hypothetical protein
MNDDDDGEDPRFTSWSKQSKQKRPSPYCHLYFVDTVQTAPFECVSEVVVDEEEEEEWRWRRRELGKLRWW